MELLAKRGPGFAMCFENSNGQTILMIFGRNLKTDIEVSRAFSIPRREKLKHFDLSKPPIEYMMEEAIQWRESELFHRLSTKWQLKASSNAESLVGDLNENDSIAVGKTPMIVGEMAENPIILIATSKSEDGVVKVTLGDYSKELSALAKLGAYYMLQLRGFEDFDIAFVHRTHFDFQKDSSLEWCELAVFKSQHVTTGNLGVRHVVERVV
ncbi:hypothetical protein K491DRAFT_716085 [Lophiostoma macrostomum CBS 122681]|uniref:Uncharacterized protein n=1 Tax=Lophiostoma macrostomum CBS 122681 TaxID=1314788 RepID=A0A6A6TAP1_9PLEO|nr:hypothetical protein K491DRAFT_716085 [Lophiostoma macrostomum CBS 122681]